MIIDLHCHVLPGIDDGAKDLETALEMCRIAQLDGISSIIATPHYIYGSMDNASHIVQYSVAELNARLKEHDIDFSIYPGCEAFICPELPELVSSGQVCTLNNTRYILVELPMNSMPEYTTDVLYRLKLDGFIPVIAHPERNAVIRSNPELLVDLINRGMMTQVNSSSITGLFGSKIKDTALHLLSRNMMHFLASDAHTTGGRSPKLSSAMSVIQTTAGEAVLQRIVSNGQSVLNGDVIEIEEPLVASKLARSSLIGNFLKRVSNGLYR